MYERYLGRVRRRNCARGHALLDAIPTDLGDRVEVTGDGAGAHVVLRPRHRVAEETVIADAASRGAGIYATRHKLLKQPSQTGFMVGSSRLRETGIREAYSQMGEVLGATRSRPRLRVLPTLKSYAAGIAIGASGNAGSGSRRPRSTAGAQVGRRVAAGIELEAGQPDLEFDDKRSAQGINGEGCQYEAR
jgi:hypothetical protein